MTNLRLIDTGGTIGMVPSEQGLVPGEGVVETYLRAILPEGVTLDVVTFDPLIDSANIMPSDWNRLADLVEAHDGPVLITHGTDTLGYTAAALSQVIAPERSVVLCAAMQPLGQKADAEDSLRVAMGHLVTGAAGVTVAVNGAILAGAGVTKTDSHAPQAFISVPQAAARVGDQGKRFREDVDIGVLTLAPGLSAKALAAQLGCFDAVVLRIYGAGTFPERADLVQAVADATARGMLIRVVSQCLTGGLAPGLYAAGAQFWQSGCTSGGTETVELALVRLSLDLAH
ncbi:asparaginase domain-containing protein (plasmid) [Thioclava sp. 'Guangxiensis']|uniref:asparaginase domain-containing protein n=1 Tax=Thioclava sp. 'Guangxiensis' TaxID=3149044 RepID=UPI0032C40BA6